ncbi:negative elongation factor A [Aplysia californica]|uniref:Negative elongation factor A n=1 Tax=Aplysia californica TaxID=6500 RepID=A0ABM0JDE3_APLCA|nr:negative elongation factor A [Aplysia californica]
MAAGDTALWLHNKLGSTDDLWSGKSICSQLTREKLITIQDCFHALQSHVKVKLLLSFLHISKRNIEQWQLDFEEIITLGMNDPDPWVATIGEILREYPATGALLMVEQDNRPDTGMVACLEEMKTLAKKSTVSMMPLECQYLNKSSLTAVAGHIPESTKHFTVKRKPKSAALRADIIHKSSETVQNKRNHASSSVPIKSRSFAKKMDTTPIRSVTGRSPLSGSDFRSPGSTLQRLNSSMGRSPITPLPLTPRSGSKKDSKIKLLELEEMPVGAKEAKRRKKIADMEALEAQKKEKEAAAAAAAANPTTAAATTVSSALPSYAPDYAAGLIAPATPKMPITVLSVSSSALSQPSPAYLPTPVRPSSQGTTLSGIGTLSSAPTTGKKQTLPQQLKQQQQRLPAAANVVSAAPSTLPMMAPILIAPQPPRPTLPAATLTSLTSAQVRAASNLSNLPTRPPTSPSLRPQQTILVQPAGTNQPQVMAVTPTPAPSTPAQTQPANAKKGLFLTKDQMTDAQEMFKASNKVSRPEKALILGFMAGSRENPCPSQGDILNIKLSEREELIQLPDGTQKKKIEDTYFQMNYATGEWKRFFKYREAAIS